MSIERVGFDLNPQRSMSEVRHARRLTDMTQHSAVPRLDPARTWTVLVGILDYPNQGFAPRGRQDVRLDRALAAWGVPDAQRRCLLDADATAEAITRTLADVTRRAGRDDSLLFYFAGHGNELPEGFALSARDRPLFLRELSESLRAFRGSSILLTADCCFSGALAEVGDALHDRGIPTGVLASIEGSTSTLQWTFTRSLIDAFSGHAFVDHDGDESISLADLAREQRLALRARDAQRAHASWHGLSPSLVLRDVVDAVRPELGWCEVKLNRWRPARVVERLVDHGADRDADRTRAAYRVRLCDITQTRFVDVPLERVRPLSTLPTHPVGTEVWALPAGGRRAAACVVAVEDDLHLVQYDHPAALACEWLPAARLTRRDEVPRARPDANERDTRWRVETARLKRAAERRRS